MAIGGTCSDLPREVKEEDTVGAAAEGGGGGDEVVNVAVDAAEQRVRDHGEHLEAIKSNQTQSEAIRSNQKQSEAIRSNHGEHLDNRTPR